MADDIKYAFVDPVIEGQQYILMSFLSKEKSKGKFDLFKFRGAFPDEASAKEYAQKLQKLDGSYDIFVGKVGAWNIYNPDPNDSELTQEYFEKELNAIMKAQKEEEFKKAQIEKERRDAMIKKALQENDEATEEKKKKQKEKTVEELVKEQEDETVEKYDKEIKGAQDALAKLQQAYNKLKDTEKKEEKK